MSIYTNSASSTPEETAAYVGGILGLLGNQDPVDVLRNTPLALAQLLERTQVLVLADEVYEHMVFDGRAHQSLLAHDSLAARGMVVSSFGKTYHATGWKIGYCIAPATLTVELRKVHQFVQFAVSTPMQAALADFMTETPGHALELAGFYQGKRDHFCALLRRTRTGYEL